MKAIPDDMSKRAVEYYMVKRDAKQTFGTTWGVNQLLMAALDGYELVPFEMADDEKRAVRACSDPDVRRVVDRAQRTLIGGAFAIELDPRLAELIDRVTGTSGPIAETLSASEWHELAEELRDLKRRAVTPISRDRIVAAADYAGCTFAAANTVVDFVLPNGASVPARQLDAQPSREATDGDCDRVWRAAMAGMPLSNGELREKLRAALQEMLDQRVTPVLIEADRNLLADYRERITALGQRVRELEDLVTERNQRIAGLEKLVAPSDEPGFVVEIEEKGQRVKKFVTPVHYAWLNRQFYEVCEERDASLERLEAIIGEPGDDDGRQVPSTAEGYRLSFTNAANAIHRLSTAEKRRVLAALMVLYPRAKEARHG